MPGRFRSDNSPWVREVMEAVVDPRVKLVSILASVQSSKTTVPELTLCYIVANLPGPTLWILGAYNKTNLQRRSIRLKRHSFLHFFRA
jgi:hypothetical protein